MSSALSILHMIPALTKGGAERVAVDLANASAREGHGVTVVAGWKVDEQVLRVRLDPSVRVIYMTEMPGGILQRYGAGLGWLLKNRKWLAVQDVLHLHLTQAAVFGTLLYFLRNITRASRPVIVETYHSVGMKISDRARAFHAWNCRHRDAIAVMALDPYWRAFIDSNPALSTELIPNGVDAAVGAATPESMHACLDEMGVPRTAKRIIGTVGQFRAERQPQIIARILMDVLKQTPNDVHALMCGAGPELESVQDLVAAEGMAGRFTFPGVINEPRLAMSAMSVYLTINIGAITGIAALEAAFCGVPVVALQFDPACEPGDDDWIWSSVVPESVSQRIAVLLADSGERERIGARQQAHAIAEHSVDSMRRKYVALYRRVIDAE